MKSLFEFKLFIGFVLSLTAFNLYSQYNWDYRSIALTGGETGTWNHHIFMPCVLYNGDSARYEMWFGASTNGPRPYRIGFAYSSDGNSWHIHPTPVLEPTNGAWDASSMEGPTVLRIDGEYKMWYDGETNYVWGIGYATSSDGINWIKDTVNIMILDSDSANSFSPSVLYTQEKGYMMWYSSVSSVESWIEYATSEDGINWINTGNISPLISQGPEGSWDDYFIYLGGRSTLIIDNKYYMWYSGTNANSLPRYIGLATSEDGSIWQKYKDPEDNQPTTMESTPVIVNYGAGASKIVESPSVLYEGDSLRMWFSGKDDSRWRIIHTSGRIEELNTSVFDMSQDHMENQFSLNIYPLPFHNITTFEFIIEASSFVSLVIYNSLGQKIEVLVKENLSAGLHKIDWQPEKLPQGIYFSRLQVGQTSVTKKLIYQ